MRPKPTCRTCGQPHYNFVACDEADVFEADQARKAAAAAEEARLRNTMSRNDFARNDFGRPKLRTVVAVAPNVFARKQP
jgi:hypothetical protein